MNKLVRFGIIGLVILLAGVLTSPVLTQEKVDPAKVSKAVDEGAAYLLDYLKNLPEPEKAQRSDELVLYTLVHSKVDPNHEEFKKLLEKILKRKWTTTYRASVLAMALEALNRRKYQYKIAECGQFLVDAQCDNGQWTYGGKRKKRAKVFPQPTPDKPGETLSVKKIKIRKHRGGKSSPAGDNSNTQYAILGLRACMDAQVIIPKATFQAAKNWLVQCQNPDGGWAYNRHGKKQTRSFGSMSVGGLGILVICEHYLKRTYKKRNAPVQKALDWLVQNFTVTRNPKGNVYWHYYYLYAVERAGMLYGTETFGDYNWYSIGAQYLFEQQKSDGSWNIEVLKKKEDWCTTAVENTCFALLFLHRATKPIITDGSK